MAIPTFHDVGIHATDRHSVRDAVALLCEWDPPERQQATIDAILLEIARQEVESRGHSPRDVTVARRESWWEARRNGQLVGVVRGQLLPGGVGFVGMPRLIRGEPASTASSLLARLEVVFRQHAAHLLQLLEPASTRRDTEILQSLGFLRQPDLLYLACTSLTIDGPATPAKLHFSPYAEDDRKRLAATLENSYVGTCDYPVLNSRRDIEDVISGYERTGDFHPSHWHFLMEGERDIGCVLVNFHSQWNCCELVYMGLVPQARGSGWGALLVQQAQRVASQCGASQLYLGVDSSNLPAVNLYKRWGFGEIERRSVFLKFLDPPSTPA